MISINDITLFHFSKYNFIEDRLPKSSKGTKTKFKKTKRSRNNDLTEILVYIMKNAFTYLKKYNIFYTKNDEKVKEFYNSRRKEMTCELV